jgi:hypothetical protein
MNSSGLLVGISVELALTAEAELVTGEATAVARLFPQEKAAWHADRYRTVILLLL